MPLPENLKPLMAPKRLKWLFDMPPDGLRD